MFSYILCFAGTLHILWCALNSWELRFEHFLVIMCDNIITVFCIVWLKLDSCGKKIVNVFGHVWLSSVLYWWTIATIWCYYKQRWLCDCICSKEKFIGFVAKFTKTSLPFSKGFCQSLAIHGLLYQIGFDVSIVWLSSSFCSLTVCGDTLDCFSKPKRTLRLHYEGTFLQYPCTCTIHESCWAVLSCGTVYYICCTGGSNF